MGQGVTLSITVKICRLCFYVAGAALPRAHSNPADTLKERTIWDRPQREVAKNESRKMERFEERVIPVLYCKVFLGNLSGSALGWLTPGASSQRTSDL